MKVKIEIKEDAEFPYAVIYTSEVTSEIQRAVSLLSMKSNIITASDRDKIIILNPDEVFMVRVEASETVIYCRDKRYLSKYRLYELLDTLGNSFMRISKSTIINLKKIDCIEPSISGMMKIYLKNNLNEYISRRYLPDFKKYLGL